MSTDDELIKQIEDSIIELTGIYDVSKNMEWKTKEELEKLYPKDGGMSQEYIARISEKIRLIHDIAAQKRDEAEQLRSEYDYVKLNGLKVDNIVI